MSTNLHPSGLEGQIPVDMQKKYATFLTDDFILDDYFVQWVNTPDLHSNLFWKDFLERYPEQQDNVLQARTIVQNLAVASKNGVPSQDKTEIWEGIVSQLTPAPRRIRHNAWFRLAAAASIVLISALVYQVFMSPHTLPDSSEIQKTSATNLTFETLANYDNTPKEYQLPDLSKVILQPGGIIRFVRNFDGPVRELTLSGEAFFDVTKNPEKPFIVKANQLVTKVLGTSFSVKAREESLNITVEVKTGKVTVFTANKDNAQDPETKGMILRPNQKVEYIKSEEKMTRSLVRDPEPQIIPETLEVFEFHEAPVPTILEAMKKIYQIEILYDKEVLAGCLLNTSLTNETLFQKLDVICEAINATYKVVDGEIIINGKKCS